jgi:hypothetical protein
VTSTHGSRNDPSKYEMWTVPHVLALWASGKRAIVLCVAPVQIDKLLLLLLSYGAPVCFRADFAAAAEILMRCTVL